MSITPTFEDCINRYKNGAARTSEELLDFARDDHPDHRVHNFLATLAIQENKIDQAIFYINRSISLEKTAENLTNKGAILLLAYRYSEAQHYLIQALEMEPDREETINNLAGAYYMLNEPQRAITLYKNLLSRSQSNAELFFRMGNAYRKAGDLLEAKKIYEEGLKIDPRKLELLNNSGTLLFELKQYQSALKYFEDAISINKTPDLLANFIRTGALALNEAQPFETCIAQAIQDFPESHLIRIACSYFFYKKRMWRKAEAILEEVHKSNQMTEEAFTLLGQTYSFLGKKDKALAMFNEGLIFFKNSPHLNNCLGNLHKERLAFERAINFYEAALRNGGLIHGRLADLLLCKTSCCDWTDLSILLNHLEKKCLALGYPETPFPLTALSLDPKLQKENAKCYFERQGYATRATKEATTGRQGQKSSALGFKKSIGYLSADFRSHPVSQLAVGLIEHHDRERFRVIGFYYGPPIEDAMRKRVEAAFDVFYDIRMMSDEEVLQLAEKEGVDIAIDLSGYTFGARTGLFAKRIAPTQINYLGYPGTMGSQYYDYIIVDNVIAPKGFESYYSEKLLRLPGCYQPNDQSRKVAEQIPSRKALGLPESAFVFCCFNNNYKILPDTFASWMRILSRCPESVLWLLQDNQTAADNLRKEAKNQGIDPMRLVFAPRCPSEQHLARQKRADLFLDTFPYNAHTTASDALWVGLPLLTRLGKSFASRVAASILTAAGLPEFITQTIEEYEATAIHLYNKTRQQKTPILSDTQIQNIQNSRLFNIIQYTKEIEGLLPRKI